MKYGIYFIFLILSLHIVYATDLFNKDFSYQDSVNIDGVYYEIIYSKTSDMVSIKSDYNYFMLKFNECKTQGYYTICFINKADSLSLIKLKATRSDCESAYYNKSLCLKKVGEICSENKECASQICLHNLCSFKKSICGDGYCDRDETCNDDCNRFSQVIKTDPYTISFSSNQYWIDTHSFIEPDQSYYFEIESNYNWDSKTYFNNSNLPCPEIKKGEVVASLCEKCYSLNNTIKLNQSCLLKVMVNDNILIDNEGNVIIEISNKAILKEKEQLARELINNYVALRNDCKYYELADLGIKAYHDLYTIQADTQSDLRNLGEPNFQHEDRNMIIKDIKFSETDDFLIANVQITDGGEEYPLVFYVVEINEELLIQDIDMGGSKFSERDLNAFRDEMQQIVDRVEYQIKNQNLDEPTKKTDESGGSLFGALILLAIIFFFYWKHKQKKVGDTKNYVSNLSREYDKLLKEKESLIKEYNKKADDVNKTNKKVEEKNQEYKNLISDMESNEKDLDKSIQELEKKINSSKGVYADKLKEKLELEKEIREIEQKNSGLTKQKIKEQIILNQKEDSLKKLEQKFKEELKEIRETYGMGTQERKNKEELLRKEVEVEKKEIEKDIEKAEKILFTKKKEEKEIHNKFILAKKKINDFEEKKETTSIKGYNSFKDNYSIQFDKTKTIPEYVEQYINIFKKDKTKLDFLVKLFQENTGTDNKDFVKKAMTKKYEEQISELIPDLISDLKDIDDMTGAKFEEYLERMFDKLGYDAKKTQTSRDGGVDLILGKDGEITLVQAKRYKITGSVGVDAVRDVYSKKKRYKADKLVVLTTAMKFSLDAINESKEHNIFLWNRDKFKELLIKSKMINNG